MQRIKTRNRLGEKSSARCMRREWGQRNSLSKPDLVRTAGGGKPQIVHPKATTEIMNSEAVEEMGWGEKNGFVLKIFV